MQEFNVSTRVYFGEGALERLRQVEDKRVLIVTDRFMNQLGVPERVAAFLTRCTVSVFDGGGPDPHRGGARRGGGLPGVRSPGGDRRGRRLHHRRGQGHP